jgi:tetratricopeptide (TPR) repeat protein
MARPKWLRALLVAVAAVAAHAPGLEGGFILYDDPGLILENEELQSPSLAGLGRIWSRIRHDAYLPLYETALLPDALLFGRDPRGYHAFSIAWHVAASLALFALFAKLLRPGSALASALLFAVHPALAESVAWASGRKDQVLILLVALGLQAHLRFLRTGRPGPALGALLLQALAGLAKGSAVVIPFLAVLVGRRVGPGAASLHARRRVLLASFLVGVLHGILHLEVARRAGTIAVESPPLPEQLAVLCRVALGYARNLLFPLSLSIHYRVPARPLLDLGVVAGGLVLVLLLVCAIRGWRRPGTAAFGLSWLAIAMLPFNTLVPRTSIPMADRYLGLGLAGAAMALALATERLGARTRSVLCVLCVLGLIASARSRSLEFRDTETLFLAADRRDPEDPMPPAQRAEARLAGRPQDPRALAEAIRLLEVAQDRARVTGERLHELRSALRLCELNLRAGRFQRVLEECRTAEALLATGSWPDAGPARAGLRQHEAQALIGLGRIPEARELLARLLLEPGAEEAGRLSLALLDLREGQEILVRRPGAELEAAGRERVDRGLQALRELAGSRDRGFSMRARFELGRALVAAPWQPGRLSEVLRQAAVLRGEAPEDPRPFQLEALVAEATGDLPAAIAASEAALLRHPESLALRLETVRLLGLAAEHRRAVALLRDGLREGGEAEPLRAALAAILVEQGLHHLLVRDGHRAQLAASEAVGLDPASARAWALHGEVQETSGRYDRAEISYRRAQRIDPSEPRSRSGLARCRQARGLGILAEMRRHLREAPPEERAALEARLRDLVVVEFRAAVELGGSSEEVAIARRYLREREEEAVADAVLDLLRRARAAAQSGSLDLAEGLLRDALRIDPTHPEALLLLGTALRARRAWPEAQECAERAIAQDPGLLPAIQLLAEVAYIRGDKATARREADRFQLLVAEAPDRERWEEASRAMAELSRLASPP